MDLYPWLGELVFYSLARVPDDQEEDDTAAINCIGFFIDEHQSNLAATLGGSAYFNPDLDPFKEYKKQIAKAAFENSESKVPYHFIVDTFGSFGYADSHHIPYETNTDLKYKEYRDNRYIPHRVAGSGNPMHLMRTFSRIAAYPSYPTSDSLAYLSCGIGNLNLFLINSISYLYRTMGFRDAMLFVREILQKGVWKAQEDEETIGRSPQSNDSDHNEIPESNPQEEKEPERLIKKNGMLFAILHDGVFSSEETRYVETFFDGVLTFKAKEQAGERVIRYRWERLPPLRNNHTNGNYASKQNPRFFKASPPGEGKGLEIWTKKAKPRT